jgi:hypothetical protein
MPKVFACRYEGIERTHHAAAGQVNKGCEFKIYLSEFFSYYSGLAQ